MTSGKRWLLGGLSVILGLFVVFTNQPTSTVTAPVATEIPSLGVTEVGGESTRTPHPHRIVKANSEETGQIPQELDRAGIDCIVTGVVIEVGLMRVRVLHDGTFKTVVYGWAFDSVTGITHWDWAKGLTFVGPSTQLMPLESVVEYETGSVTARVIPSIMGIMIDGDGVPVAGMVSPCWNLQTGSDPWEDIKSYVLPTPFPVQIDQHSLEIIYMSNLPGPRAYCGDLEEKYGRPRCEGDK